MYIRRYFGPFNGVLYIKKALLLNIFSSADSCCDVGIRPETAEREIPKIQFAAGIFFPVLYLNNL